jgi:hypothetical protein
MNTLLSLLNKAKDIFLCVKDSTYRVEKERTGFCPDPEPKPIVEYKPTDLSIEATKWLKETLRATGQEKLTYGQDIELPPQKTFIITEQFFNGTVTIAVMTNGIQAENFTAAKEILKSLESFKIYAVSIIETGDESISWRFDGNGGITGGYGSMTNKPLTILNEN